MMKQVILLGLAISAALASSPAHASYVSGNFLYEQCSSDDVADQNYCLGFIIGVADRGEVYQTYAIPAGVEAGQVKDVVVNLLKERPEKRQLPANLLIEAALREAWPIARKKP